MRVALFSLWLLFVCSIPSLGSTGQPVVERMGTGQATIRFFATSTLHDFTGQVRCEPFTWRILKDPNSGELVIAAQPQVKALKMNTGNKKRDTNMYKMFNTQTFPLIQSQIKNAKISSFLPQQKQATPQETPQDVPGQLPLTLTIRNQTHPIMSQVTAFTTSPERTTFTATFETSIKDFGLTPPSVLGVIRVGDKVRVKMDVVLTAPPQTPVVPASDHLQTETTPASVGGSPQ